MANVSLDHVSWAVTIQEPLGPAWPASSLGRPDHKCGPCGAGTARAPTLWAHPLCPLVIWYALARQELTSLLVSPWPPRDSRNLCPPQPALSGPQGPLGGLPAALPRRDLLRPVPSKRPQRPGRPGSSTEAPGRPGKFCHVAAAGPCWGLPWGSPLFTERSVLLAERLGGDGPGVCPDLVHPVC